jgi:hypothetical protein
MGQYTAFDATVEVNGETVLSLVKGVGVWEESARRILAENGIHDPQPGAWYSQQAWLNAFAVISAIGARTLAAIGRCVPENTSWPPEVRTIHDAIASIDVAYHMNHRRGGRVLFDPDLGVMEEGIGNYRVGRTTRSSAEVVCNTPHPCAFDTGVVNAIAQEFAPPGTRVSVEHSGRCREQGALSCTLLVRW